MAQTHRGFFAWLQDNARILLSIALVLFLLFAVYSYSKRTENVQYTSDQNDAQSLAANAENADELILDQDVTDVVLGDDSELTGSGGGLDEATEIAQELAETTETQLEQAEPIVVEEQVMEQKAMKQEGAIVVSAGSGDGLTHLARRATSEYITENSIDYLDAAQRVFIEDHLRRQATQVAVHPGTELSFDNESIATAIQRAQDLSEAQRANLAKYAARVSSFQ